MFLQNVKFALTNFKKNLSSSFFIISGLSITVATIAIIMVYFNIKITSNGFIKDIDRTLLVDYSVRHKDGNNWGTRMTYRFIKEVIEPIEEIDNKTIYRASTNTRWVNNERIVTSMTYTDHRYTDVFNLEFVTGSFFNEAQYNAGDHVAVISESKAIEIYGSTDIIGQETELRNKSYTIIGVFKDVPKLYRNVNFDELAPITTDDIPDRETSNINSARNYAAAFTARTAELVNQVKLQISERTPMFEVEREGFEKLVYPYTIYEDTFELRTAINSSGMNKFNYEVFVSSMVLIIILLIICTINIINLQTSIYINRNIELGIKLAFGANNFQLFKQGMVEALLYGGMSIVNSLIFTGILINIFNQIEIYKNAEFGFEPIIVAAIVFICFAVLSISHVIAFLRLRRSQPVYILKGAF